MSDTPLCPNCNIPYVVLSKRDKRQLALAREYVLVCRRCFAALDKEDSTPEFLFDQLSLERSYYLSLIQSFRSIETAKTLLKMCEDLRTLFAPDSNVRYAWAHVAPEMLRELWAVMDKIGGTVPLRPASLTGPLSVSEPFIQDVLRALDEVVRWCAAKQGSPPTDGPTMEGMFFVGGVPHRFANLQWRLLKTLYGKGSVAFEVIGDQVWGDSEWTDGRLRKLVCDTNAKLLGYQLRFEIISPMDAHYLLQELPAVTPQVTGT
jgi:hypothetical protein